MNLIRLLLPLIFVHTGIQGMKTLTLQEQNISLAEKRYTRIQEEYTRRRIAALTVFGTATALITGYLGVKTYQWLTDTTIKTPGFTPEEVTQLKKIAATTPVEKIGWGQWFKDSARWLGGGIVYTVVPALASATLKPSYNQLIKEHVFVPITRSWVYQKYGQVSSDTTSAPAPTHIKVKRIFTHFADQAQQIQTIIDDLLVTDLDADRSRDALQQIIHYTEKTIGFIQFSLKKMSPATDRTIIQNGALRIRNSTHELCRAINALYAQNSAPYIQVRNELRTFLHKLQVDVRLLMTTSIYRF